MNTTAPANAEYGVCDSVTYVLGLHVPNTQGACLGATAMLARALTDQEIPCVAVRGRYNNHPHWWVQTDTDRLDPTRGQFDLGAPTITPLSDPGPYVVEETWPPRWTHEEVMLELARMFADPFAGRQLAREIQADFYEIHD